ncbi:MAG: hypothetical protein GWP08_20265 [Nitrospiraceae bacterium]|nr:hypothetical protein [Nitrospiraceae bacterium]
MYFAACVLDHDARLRVMAGFVENAAKRVFGIPDFKCYALTDGLRAILTRHPGAPVSRVQHPTARQMNLFAFDSSRPKANCHKNFGGTPAPGKIPIDKRKEIM